MPFHGNSITKSFTSDNLHLHVNDKSNKNNENAKKKIIIINTKEHQLAIRHNVEMLNANLLAKGKLIYYTLPHIQT